jgi:hypothetical protein
MKNVGTLLISDSKSLLLPSCTVIASKRDQAETSEAVYEYRRDSIAIESNSEEFDLRHASQGFGITLVKQVRFDAVVLEQSFNDIRPDVVGMAGDNKLFIEIAVTHFVDREKLNKVRSRKVSTIEIDMASHHRKDWTWEKLKAIVNNDLSSKAWLYNAYAESLAEKDLRAREARVAPLLKAKAEREEAERRKREALHAEIAKRREYVKQNIEATHDIKITWPNGLTHHIELCKKHTRLSAWRCLST